MDPDTTELLLSLLISRYLWTIDGTFNQCSCDAWVCSGGTQAMVKDDSALFTWHGPTKGFCCRCRPG